MGHAPVLPAPSHGDVPDLVDRRAARMPRPGRPADSPTPDPGCPAAERELMRAMQDYKERSGRMFPTWSEVLEVLRDLGYEKIASA